MSDWPPEVAFALQESGNQYPGDELSAESFASQWGGLERTKKVRALQEGTEDDDVSLAVLALGFPDTPETRELLVSLLDDRRWSVRWVSAYCLGRFRDRRALLALRAALTEDVSEQIAAVQEPEEQTYWEWFVLVWRQHIEQLLHSWETTL